MTTQSIIRQVHEWAPTNSAVPESVISDCCQAALNAPARAGSRLYKIWLPHREPGQLDAVKLLMSETAACQMNLDVTYQNVHSAMVFVCSQTETSEIQWPSASTPESQHADIDDGQSFQIMHDIMARKWSTGQRLMDPFHGWIDSASASVSYWGRDISFQTQTMAMAVQAAAQEAVNQGYHVQFVTAWEHSKLWLNRWGNKFQSDSKWWPYMIMFIGSEPAKFRISGARIKNFDLDTTQSIVTPWRQVHGEDANDRVTHVVPNTHDSAESPEHIANWWNEEGQGWSYLVGEDRYSFAWIQQYLATQPADAVDTQAKVIDILTARFHFTEAGAINYADQWLALP